MRPARRRAARAAFTVAEIVVVVALVSVVVTLLYRFLLSGSRSVSLGAEELEGVRRANLALERIKRDLRSLCDVVGVTGGTSEIDSTGHTLTFQRFSSEPAGNRPAAFKVVYKAEKVRVTRAGEPADGVRLRGYYGDATTPVLDEDCFTEVRFKKYRLNGLSYYQVRMGVPDVTGKSGKTHWLQTSVGSRYYHTFTKDPNWLALDESHYETARGGRSTR
ncbi:MAG: hypothetical protein HY816_12465 [Candidatus Wallbacteria bacterium]|nr:hypothetical protein [Candidatus Wallbacteria bacterium]